MATIADVAAHARVGVGTVSRVLNDSPSVSEATRAKVLAAIEFLDYRPNPMAQGLSKGRCLTLGAVVPFFTHASAVERLRGVVAVLDHSRYDLVLFNVESPVHRDEHFAALTRRGRADGLLVMSLPPPADGLRKLRQARVPVVLLDSRAPGVPVVVTDDVEGGRMATRHLIELGHERIAFMGDHPDNPFGFTSSADRETGFCDAMGQAGLEVRPGDVVHAPHVRTAAARAAGEALLDRADPPTAIVTASDTQALGVLEAARAAGRKVPADLSVVGYDDIELASYAGLTTVRQPLYESGRRAAALLLEALEADPPAEAAEPAEPGTASGTDGAESTGQPTVELDLELVVRSTTAARPGGGGVAAGHQPAESTSIKGIPSHG